MNVSQLIFSLNSAQPEALLTFYRDVIGLKPNPEMGENALMAANTAFVIDGHSELSGGAAEPPRTLSNFLVDDVRAEKTRLETKGVRFLGDPSADQISFATFVDPDGNYGQVFSMAGAPAGGEMFAVMRSSADPDRLKTFYRDILGLSDDFPHLGNPFMAGETAIYIGAHSDVRGATKEPARAMLNLFVEDLETEQKRMDAHGVKFIRTAGKEYWGGVISTFVDPDGSYGQIIEFRP